MQHLGAFDVALETGQDQRPACTDFLEHLASRLEPVMDHRQLDLILLALQFESHARWFSAVRAVMCAKRISEAARRIMFEDLAGAIVFVPRQPKRKWRADLPVRNDGIAVPIELRRLGVS